MLRVYCLCTAAVLGLLCHGQIQATTIFTEDFDDGIADGFMPQIGDWEVVDGIYHCHTEGFEVWGVSIAGDESWADYIFDCDVRVQGSAGHIVRFRVESQDDYYQLNVRAGPFHDVYLTKWIGGVRHELIHVSSFENYLGEWHHISIAAEGPEILVIVNGAPLFSYFDFDTPFLQGPIGLVSSSGGGIQWQDAYFDNVQVMITAVPDVRATWGQVKSLYR